jgi:hypothetical protein
MPLSWNEIKARAFAFSKEWEHETSEDAEAKSFWDGFFYIFDVSRRRLATFETSVRKGDSKQGFIDLLWKGVILVEHKSRGKDLEKAFQQAKDYFPGLKEHELPKYILVSDFERFNLYDLDTGVKHEFHLNELAANAHLFGLDTRTKYPSSSLADLYSPLTMPPDLVKAHQALDKAVDLCYRPQQFVSELARIEFLFGLFEQYTMPMFGMKSKK